MTQSRAVNVLLVACLLITVHARRPSGQSVVVAAAAGYAAFSLWEAFMHDARCCAKRTDVAELVHVSSERLFCLPAGSLLIASWGLLNISAARATQRMVLRSSRAPGTLQSDAASDEGAALPPRLQQQQQQHRPADSEPVQDAAASTSWQQSADDLDDQKGQTTTAGATAEFAPKMPFHAFCRRGRSIGSALQRYRPWRAVSAQHPHCARVPLRAPL